MPRRKMKRRDRDGAEFLTCPNGNGEEDWDSGMGAEEAGVGEGGGEA